MINKAEIDSKASDFEVHASNIQKDYIHGWLLYSIFTVSSLKDIIFLKGGNALRKGYFANTRYSDDLDFGIPEDINQQDLLEDINCMCKFISEKSGVEFILDKNKIEEKFTATDAPLPDLKVYEITVYFKDFYGRKSRLTLKISMDITRFDKVVLPIQEVELIHPYSDSKDLVCKIRCMKLEEIIACKLKCLLQRQHAPDLFDYAYSIKLLGGNLDKEEVTSVLLQKTIFERNPHVLKDILKNISQSYFREAWDSTIKCSKGFIIGVEESFKILLTDLDSIFSIYPENTFFDFIYVGHKHRVPIMEAGRTQTLLKFRYKGADRIVEPYSIKYLEKKDGSKKEYFYAYNRSGGSSEPGMRCFLPDGIESVENTRVIFSPQYRIELCKAGELPEEPYLFDPNRPARRSFSTKRSVGWGYRYKYQCSSCGKTFTRSRRDNKLRDHKSPSKILCRGTYGIYLGMK